MTRKCTQCSEVVPGNRVLCLDCGRKNKISNQTRQCSFPLCAATYRTKGFQKYCIKHKSMNSRARETAIAIMRKNGLLRDD